MQLPALRAARRLGLRVIVADGNHDAVGRDEADEFLHVDLKDHLEMTRAATAIRSQRGLDAVFTAGTDFSATVAYVAQELGLPGTRYEAALNATNKYRMRQVLRDAGVSVPDFAIVTREELDQSGCERPRRSVSLPVVIKPADSMGARGVVRADDWADAEAFARDALAFSRSGSVVVEGYIDGPEFSLDAIVYGDDIQVTGFADRHICFPPYFIEMGHTLPTVVDMAEQKAIIRELERAIKALGIGPGAAKGDVKLSASGVVIGEVAARLSGGYMSGWTYPLATGVPLSEIAIRVALGEPPQRATPRWSKTSAERAVISIPGVLREIRGADVARSMRGVEEVFVTRSAGTRMSFPRSNVEKVANVIAVSEDRGGAVRAAEAAVRAIEPVLAAGDAETDRFVFASAGLPPEYRHWAFPALADTATDLLPVWRRMLAAGPVPVIELAIPSGIEKLAERDWAYRTVQQTLDALCADGRVRARAISKCGRPDARSRILLRAIAKGGLQAGAYVVDSLTGGG